MFTKKIVEEIVEKTILTSIEDLSSDANLNKNGLRVLIREGDARYRSVIQSVKSNASFLDGGDVEVVDSIVYNATKKYLELLRDKELLEEGGRSYSVKRTTFNVWFKKVLRKAITEGILEDHPLKTSRPCIIDMHQTPKMKKNNEKAKLAILKVEPNISFDSWMDDVVKVQKVVSTTSK